MLVRITCFAALGGFLFGYDLGLIGPALLTYQRETSELDTVAIAAIVGSAKLGAVVGTFIGGACMLYYGRQPTIALSGVFFVIGPALMASFALTWVLIIGRLLIGLGIGISAVAIPAYLGEISPAKYRGRIVEMYELLLCVGMVTSQLFDWAVQDAPGNWRLMFGAPLVPGILLLFGLLVLPESPRWLVVQGRLDEALAVMHRVYTKERLPIGVQQSTAEVEHELLLLWSGVQQESAAAAERRKAAAGKGQGAGRSGAGNGLLRKMHVRRKGRAFDPLGEEQSTGFDAEEGGIELTPPQGFVLGGGSNGSPVDHVVDHEDGPAEPTDAGGAPRGYLPPSHVPPPVAEDDSPAAVVAVEEPAEEEGGAGPSMGPPRGSQHLTHEHSGDGSGARESASLSESRSTGTAGFFRTFGVMMWDIVLVARGPEQRAFFIALTLAVFNQATASTAIINFAPKILASMNVESSDLQTGLAITVTISKFIGLIIALLLVDVAGRRPLLISGSAMCGACMVLVSIAYFITSTVLLVIGMDLFMLGFSMSWAGIFWVLISEIFSMNVKSPASSMATATLFAAGAVVDWAFLGLKNGLGGWSFLIYAAVAFGSGVFVFFMVPETKGRTLAEIQRMLGSNVSNLRPATSVPAPPVAVPFAAHAVVDSSGTSPPKGRRGVGPLSGQGSGDLPSPEDQGSGVGAWWRRTTRAMQRGLGQAAPRVVLRRRFDKMPEGGTDNGVVPQT